MVNHPSDPHTALFSKKHGYSVFMAHRPWPSYMHCISRGSSFHEDLSCKRYHISRGASLQESLLFKEHCLSMENAFSDYLHFKRHHMDFQGTVYFKRHHLLRGIPLSGHFLSMVNIFREAQPFKRNGY